MNFRSTWRVLGRLLLVLAAAEILPVFCCLFYGETQAAMGFVATGLLTGACGWILIRSGTEVTVLYRREGVLIVVGGWVLASIFGALPYLLTGTLAHPLDALFESASGFTTTGASVLTDIEGSGRGILLWRSFSQWLGGMGIIVLFVALLPELGAGARFLYQLEVPGPTAETLRPRVRETAMALWQLYMWITAAQVVCLSAAGLNLYDSLTHTFSTLSTGGFSPRNTSVEAFESPWVHIIIIVFMIIAGANFSLYYGLLRDRGRSLFRDAELRTYLAIIFGASALITWNLLAEGTYTNVAKGFLDSLFQVVSVVTTTGFATADFDAWPRFSAMTLVLLMFLGGCAGSTAGGPKIMRMIIGVKSALREVRTIFSPSTVESIFIAGKPVPNHVVRSVAGFFILYVTIWATGTYLLTLDGPEGGLDLVSAATASIATLGNIGPGLELVGPTQNFAFFPAWQKLLMVILMWLGRLEVYVIVALVSPAYWRR